jgi:hypothetical protein
VTLFCTFWTHTIQTSYSATKTLFVQ